MKCSDVTVVGAGLSGLTAARLFADKGCKVKIYDTRDHIGGNCAEKDIDGVRIHAYGPHIFHTDDEEVFEFLSRFTEWVDFELRPLGNTRLGVLPLPYSKATIKALGRELSADEIRETIFKEYSEKQWGVQFEEIPKTITNRIPDTADCENPTWFKNQKYQCLPRHGYNKMFEKMVDHPNITVFLNTDIQKWKNNIDDLIVYTGKIDEYFDYCYGKLPYRSLDFHHKFTHEKQNTFIVNQNRSDVPYTRIYDHSYLNPDHDSQYTVITSELPKECLDGDIPYYPIPWGQGQELYRKYEELAKEAQGVIFLGRLSRYKYLDMWMAVKHVLISIDKFYK
jgi:UDP-galactopyranose mutase